jgi:hypothetical protein
MRRGDRTHAFSIRSITDTSRKPEVESQVRSNQCCYIAEMAIKNDFAMHLMDLDTARTTHPDMPIM